LRCAITIVVPEVGAAPLPTPLRCAITIAVLEVGAAPSPTMTSPTILLSTRILKITTLHKK
jgi:hypothetical protein